MQTYLDIKFMFGDKTLRMGAFPLLYESFSTSVYLYPPITVVSSCSPSPLHSSLVAVNHL